MCEMCQKVELIEVISTPRVYFDCPTYIQSLVDSGDFIFEAKDCETDMRSQITRLEYGSIKDKPEIYK